MRIDELLQVTFQERAAEVADDRLSARAAAVHRRVRVAQRRRAAAAAGAAAVVIPLAVAAMTGLNPMDRTDNAPDPSDTPGIGSLVRESFAGRTLIASRATYYGNELELTVDAPGGSDWLLSCAGVGPEYTLHQTLDGKFEREAPCDRAQHALGTMSMRFTKDEPAEQRELRLWVTRTSDGTVVTPDKAVLVAAVYQLPDPVAQVAGSDILPVEENGGLEWALVDFRESELGERSLSVTIPAADEEQLLELASAGTGGGRVRLLVDGVHEQTYDLDSVNLGDRLSPGKAHRVTLRIDGTVPADALLGIVWRTQ